MAQFRTHDFRIGIRAHSNSGRVHTWIMASVAQTTTRSSKTKIWDGCSNIADAVAVASKKSRFLASAEEETSMATISCLPQTKILER